MIICRSIFVSCLILFAAACAASAQPKAATENYEAAARYSERFRGLSVLVVKNDRIVFEQYQNGHSADATHHLASGSKSFVGVMLAAAIEDKLIKNFDEKVSDTIAEWKRDRQKSKITVRQLLSLTSGIDTGANGNPPSYAEAVRFEMKYAPGGVFEYGPVPFQVFGELMTRKLAARGETVAGYLEKRIFAALGIKIVYRQIDGQPDLPGGARATARDWAKFGQFVKNGGRSNGKQIVAKKLLDECFKGSAANPNYGLTFWLNRSSDGAAKVAKKTNGRNQGLQELLGIEPETTRISQNGVGSDFPRDLMLAAGAGKQRLYIVPSQNLIIVRQGRQARFDDAEFLSLLLGGKSVAELKTAKKN